jgi:hypothetical protein
LAACDAWAGGVVGTGWEDWGVVSQDWVEGNEEDQVGLVAVWTRSFGDGLDLCCVRWERGHVMGRYWGSGVVDRYMLHI